MKGKRRERFFKLYSIKSRQLLLLFSIFFFIMVCSYFIFHAVSRVSVNAIYQRMESQAEYYVASLDYQIAGIIQQQVVFFSDRQLAFLTDRQLIQNDYDRREALLSVQDRLFILKSSNILIQELSLYIPQADYLITPSRVDELREGDWEKLEMIKGQQARFVPVEGGISYTLSESPYASEANFYLQVVLDAGQLRENLNTFASGEGGAFAVQAETDWLLEDSVGAGLADKIYEKIGREELNKRLTEVTVDGKVYLVSIAPSDYFTLIQYYPRESVLAELNMYTWIFAAFLVIAGCLAVLFSGYTEKMVNRPLKKLQQAFGELQQGNMDIRIHHSSRDEFEYIYEGFNYMTRELQRMIDEIYVQKNLTQKAELKQLQTQINPHFLYNSFFLLSRWVKRGDLENAGTLAEHLGTYFRFLNRNAKDTVPLKEEIEHAQCYAKIQEARFGDRIRVLLEPLPVEAEDIMVPRLIVQPVLENAFEHGLENREEDGVLKISYGLSEDTVRIHIENNGEITEEELQEMEDRLKDDYVGEMTGLANSHKRLRIFFKGRGGMEVRRGPMGGVEVTLCIVRA